MLVFPPDVTKTGTTLLTVMALGYAKRSSFDDYRTQSRGGKGIINVKVTPKNGKVINVLTVDEKDEVIIVTTKGMIVRSSVDQIRTSGRNAQGVRVIRLKEGHKVASATRVLVKEEKNPQQEFDAVKGPKIKVKK